MTFESYILIGGQSSRMGKDKFLLVLNGKTFLKIAVKTLQNFGRVTIAGNISETFAGAEELSFIRDIYQIRGALGGIHSALVHSKSDWTIILACDYPFVSAELIGFLTNLAKTEKDFDALAPIQADGKIQPLCAIYKTETCRERLSEILENGDEKFSVRGFLQRVQTRYVKFAEIAYLPDSANFFFNVNTPTDLEKAELLATNIRILKMTADDLEEILKIQQESNLSYWSYEAYADEINQADSFSVVAKIDDRTVGFLVARLIVAERCAELYNIGVDLIFRRKKVGAKLLESFIKYCLKKNLEKIFLEVRESNATAIQFYLKNNFTVLSKRKNFYTNPTEDALLMVNKL